MRMTKKKAREQIAELLMNGGFLEEILSGRVNAFLGSDVDVESKNISVDFSSMSFTFSNATVGMADRSWGSREADSIDRKQCFIIRGSGKFNCSGNDVTEIYKVKDDCVEEGDVKIIRL
jgi:hypothetical protein